MHPALEYAPLRAMMNIMTGGLATMFPVSNPELTHANGIYLGDNLLLVRQYF